jgi:hypothetical protein
MVQTKDKHESTSIEVDHTNVWSGQDRQLYIPTKLGQSTLRSYNAAMSEWSS